MDDNRVKHCESCPCPVDVPCYSHKIPRFCEWAKSGNPTQVDHIVNRSRIAKEQPYIQDRSGKPQDAPGEASGFKMLDDPVRHQEAYMKATGCPHKESVQMCCGPVDRCGRTGKNPLKLVQIADCYRCVVNGKGG